MVIINPVLAQNQLNLLNERRKEEKKQRSGKPSGTGFTKIFREECIKRKEYERRINSAV